MIGGFGFIIFLFLVPSPEDVDLGPAEGTRNSVSNVEVDPLLNSKFLTPYENILSTYVLSTFSFSETQESNYFSNQFNMNGAFLCLALGAQITPEFI